MIGNSDTVIRVLLIGTFFFSVRSSTAVLPHYSAHVTGCNGRKIASGSIAGQVQMTSGYLRESYYRTKRCDFTVAPKQLADTFNRVMFYFSEFELRGDCRDMNVTVYDGNKSLIEGLDGVLCGHNKTVVGKVFTSKESEIRILYRWSDRVSYFNTDGSFNLVFISFYDGPCQSEDGVFTCSENKRCISSRISCRDDIDYCGNGTDTKCILSRARKTILQTLMNMARNLFTIVAIFVGLSLLKKICYNRLRDKHGSIFNFPGIRRIFGNNTSNRDRRRHESLCQNTNIRDAEVIALTAQDIPPINNNNTTGTIIAPPPYEEIYNNRSDNSPTICLTQDHSAVPPGSLGASIAPPSPAPPSYEDAVANSDRYVEK